MLYVLGIGASAGGLEALGATLAHLPKTGRLACVIAQHMAADGHGELMARLLGVRLAEPGDVLQGDQIYLLPAGQDAVVAGGRLRLQPEAPESLSRPSVNVLLESLARECGPRAIGLILSGTGSDGVRGARALRAAGGLSLAQDPRTARYSGMPQAAIDAGVVDEVLAPQHIGARLARLVVGTPPAPPGPEPALPQVLKRVKEFTGIDFTHYKPETLLRRLETRLTRLGVPTVEAYLARLHTAEAQALAQHFLVSLSSFFRDPQAFAALQHALPTRPELRIWVPGCASGEECYSLAILAQRPASVVGSDLNALALARAQAAVYPKAAFATTDPAVLARHFTATGAGYQVSESTRRMCTFIHQDVAVASAPGVLDLISCRNLLIYLQTGLQEALLRKFHAALVPAGLLFLGPSENLGVLGRALFLPVDEPRKIYRKRSA